RLDDIRAAAAEWERYAQTLPALRSNEAADADAAIHQEGQRRMAGLRDRLTAFIATEGALRDQRRLATNRAAWIVITASLVISLPLGGMLTAAAWRFILLVGQRYGQALADIQVHADAIRGSAEQFHALFTQAPLGIALWRDDRMLLTNAAFASLFGYDNPSELENQPWSSVVAPEYRDELHSRIVRHAEGMLNSEAYQTDGLRKDGTLVSCYIRVARITLPDGPALVVYVTDRSA